MAAARAPAATATSSTTGTSTTGTSATTGARPRLPCVSGREVKFVLCGTWGDPNFVGLTGLQLLGPTLQPLSLTANMLSAYPQDINSVPGHSGAALL
jgi:hypothetical protein